MNKESKKKRTLKLGGIPFFPPCDIYPNYHSDWFKSRKPPKGPRNISPVKEPPMPSSEMPPVRDPQTPPSNRPEDPSKYACFM
jgi:hypothetical protein